MTINFAPTIKQYQMFKYFDDNETTEVLYGGAASGGKSYGICALIIMKCLQFKDIRVGLARNELTTLKRTTVVSLFEVLNNWNLKVDNDYKYNSTTGEITFSNGSKIILLELKYIPSDSLYQRLNGNLLTWAVIDEAGEVPEQGKQILQSRLGRWKNDEYNIKPILFMTCNPSKNFLYRDFYLLSEENKLPKHRKFIQALIADNPHTSKDYEQNLIRSLSISDRERLIGGNWRYSDDPTNLLEYNDILNTFIKTPAQSFKQRYISADIAFTSDKCVIMLWEDLTLIKIIVNPDKPEDEINRLSKEYNVKSHNITFDSDGVGKYLSNYLTNATPIVNNARALFDENYDNLKTQLYFKLVEKIKDNSLKIVNSPYNDAIQEELSLIRHKPTDTVGKIQMVSKGDIKRILGHSPDFTDALAYRMYFCLRENDFDQYKIISFNF